MRNAIRKISPDSDVAATGAMVLAFFTFGVTQSWINQRFSKNTFFKTLTKQGLTNLGIGVVMSLLSAKIIYSDNNANPNNIVKGLGLSRCFDLDNLSARGFLGRIGFFFWISMLGQGAMDLYQDNKKNIANLSDTVARKLAGRFGFMAEICARGKGAVMNLYRATENKPS